LTAKHEGEKIVIRKSSANLALKWGQLVTKLKLYRIAVTADAPQPILTHTCRSDIHLKDRCLSCQADVRITEPKKTGNAKGKAATEPKDKICPSCHVTLVSEQVLFCGTCNRVTPPDEIQNRLEFDGKTVEVTADELTQWQALTPQGNEMRPVTLVWRSHIGSYLMDEAYQLVPEKGSTLSFAAWLTYLHNSRQALVVHFHIAKHFRMGMLYPVKVRGVSTLLLHTLYAYDEIVLTPFEVPQIPDDVISQLGELTRPLRTGREPNLTHPQRRAFRALFEAKASGDKAQFKKYGALPGELEALSAQLGERLSEAKPKRGRKKKSKLDPSV